jgi:hypothetical protein
MRHFIFHLVVLSLLVASLGGTFTTAANANETSAVHSGNMVDKISQSQNQRLETMKQKLEQKQTERASKKEQRQAEMTQRKE